MASLAEKPSSEESVAVHALEANTTTADSTDEPPDGGLRAWSCVAGGYVLALPLPAKRSSSDGGKFIFAHFMVGNSYPYGPSDWTNDFNLAMANGIAGFALNFGSDSWQPGHMADACVPHLSHQCTQN